MDTARHKEAVLKEHAQPWIDEAFTITANIKGKLAHIQGMHAKMQGKCPEFHRAQAAQVAQDVGHPDTTEPFSSPAKELEID